MNISIQGEASAAAAAQSRYDLHDWMTFALIGAGFVASWIYVFLHPSNEAFITCVGAVGTFGAIFHWLCVHDSKMPDA